MKAHTDPENGITCVLLSTTDREQLAHAKSLLLSVGINGHEALDGEFLAALRDACSLIGDLLAPPTARSPRTRPRVRANPMPASKQCYDCSRYAASDSECRLYPPDLLKVKKRLVSRFPRVLATDWCAQFEQASPKPTRGVSPEYEGKTDDNPMDK